MPETTVEKWPNGSVKSVTEVTKHPDGSTKSVKKSSYKRGKDKDTRGDVKKEEEQHFDEQGRTTRIKKITYKKGVKSTESSEDIEYNNGKRFKSTVVETEYCPDGVQKKKEKIIVSYWRGQRWVKEESESSVKKWNCETGEEISWGGMTTGKEILVAVIALAGISLTVFDFSEVSFPTNIVGVALFILALMLFRLFYGEEVKLLKEEIEFERSLWTESGTDPDIIEDSE